MTNITQEKEKIRQVIRGKLKSHTLHERELKSRQISEKLKQETIFKNAKTIMFYLATDEEVQTRNLIEEAFAQGKRILLPYIHRETGELKPSRVRDLTLDLEKGSYGILEPKKECLDLVELKEIELVIVPGLAFDQTKHRLGRGKGYYDRFLAKLPRNIQTIGFAFDFQILERIPATELDIPLSRVIHN